MQDKASLKEPHTTNIFFPTFDTTLTNTESTKSLVDQIEDNLTLDLGNYPRKELLLSDLERKIFGEGEVSDALLRDSRDSITRIIEDGITKTSEYVSTARNVAVFVFPTTNKSASEFMGGINAFALGKYSIYLFVDPEIEGWEGRLEHTIAHEYSHLVTFRYFKNERIIDEMVLEGLAEHTREHLYGGDRARWSVAIPREEALLNLKNLPEEVTDLLITEENYDLQLSYFFGTKDLPNWYGYSLGYWLIDEILKTTNLPLPELFKTKPIEILNMLRKD